MDTFSPATIVSIRYTNYRGETALRRIVPQGIRFASTDWHPEPQWVMDAYDIDRQAKRSFALRDVVDWHPSEASTDMQVSSVLASLEPQ